jgi:hypothetical protein
MYATSGILGVIFPHETIEMKLISRSWTRCSPRRFSGMPAIRDRVLPPGALLLFAEFPECAPWLPLRSLDASAAALLASSFSCNFCNSRHVRMSFYWYAMSSSVVACVVISSAHHLWPLRLCPKRLEGVVLALSVEIRHICFMCL